VVPEGATLIDNSAITLDEAVQQVLQALNERGLKI
jgi:cytidylate kinase